MKPPADRFQSVVSVEKLKLLDHGSLEGIFWNCSGSLSPEHIILIEDDRLGAQLRDNHALRFNGESDHVEVQSLQYDGTYPITIEATVTTEFLENEAPQLKSIMGWDALFDAVINKQGVFAAQAYAPDGAVTHLRVPGNPTLLTGSPHLAAVWDGKQLRAYVDGRASGQADLAAIRQLQSLDGKFLDHFTLAAKTLIAKKDERKKLLFFRGQLDEVRVSKVARYDKDFVPSKRYEADKDTMALWHFDEGTGDVLKDSSGNNHHGKIVGAKWVGVAY